MDETDTSAILIVPVESAATHAPVIASKPKSGIVTRVALCLLLIVLTLVWLALVGVMVLPAILIGGKK